MNKLLKQIKKNEKEFDKNCNPYISEMEFDINRIKRHISQSRKKELEALVEETKIIREAVRKATGSFKYDTCYDDIIILIQKTILDL